MAAESLRTLPLKEQMVKCRGSTSQPVKRSAIFQTMSEFLGPSIEENFINRYK